jgi:cephalosporin hydroxylase
MLVILLAVLMGESSLAAAPPAWSSAPPRPAAFAYKADPGVSVVEVANPVFEKRLLYGFYWAHTIWRWTAPEFAVLLDSPAASEPVQLAFEALAPKEFIEQVPEAVLTATVNGVEVGRREIRGEGRLDGGWEVPAAALKESPAKVVFTLDKAARVRNHSPEKMPEGQPFGLIVLKIGLTIDEETPVTRATAVNLARQGYRRLAAERRLKLPEDKYREVQKLFHEIPVWSHTWFGNVKIEKTPLDLWMVQQILYEVRPEFIVETGTWRGGSALYWAHTLQGLGLVNSRVLTVDLQNITANAAANPLWTKYVRFFQGSSTDPKIVSAIHRIVKGRRTLVMLDSDHSMKHVLAELEAYAPMVTSGSYLIVEDTHMDGVPTYPHFGPGPAAAVKAFLEQPAGKSFFVDEEREAMIITFNPGGWLRRR